MKAERRGMITRMPIVEGIAIRSNPRNSLETLTILRTVSRAAGQETGPGWNLIVLHHTNCGIVGCYHAAPDLLAKYMGVEPSALEALAVTDPYEAVQVDVAALKANPNLPGTFIVTGLVYDVATGKIDAVVPPALLRPD